jgi:hypothetical protein
MRISRPLELICYVGLALLTTPLVMSPSPLPYQELKFEPDFSFNRDSLSGKSSWWRTSFENMRLNTAKLTLPRVSEPTVIFLLGSVLLGVGIALRKRC